MIEINLKQNPEQKFLIRTKQFPVISEVNSKSQIQGKSSQSIKYFRSVTCHNSIISPHVQISRVAFQNVFIKNSSKVHISSIFQEAGEGKNNKYICRKKTPREQKFKRQKHFGLELPVTCQHPRRDILVNKPSPIPSGKGSL